jgi:Ran GTPase-activating protein (RanGAP) involved in mRNA processing and transport
MYSKQEITLHTKSAKKNMSWNEREIQHHPQRTGSRESESRLMYASLLRRNEPSLKDLVAVNLKEAEAKTMLCALAGNTVLVSLNLADQTGVRAAAKELVNALRQNTMLASLELSRNGGIGSGHYSVKLAKTIFSNPGLNKLVLSCNKFKSRHCMQKMSSLLCHNTSLTSLNLSGNGIGDYGARRIASALAKNSTLRTLSLAKNLIGPLGAIEIAHMIKHNVGLTSLDISKNHIRFSGAIEIASALKQNHRFTFLECMHTASGSGESAIRSALVYWKMREHLLAFVMGMHPRLGKGTVVGMLVDECVREVGHAFLELSSI